MIFFSFWGFLDISYHIIISVTRFSDLFYPGKLKVFTLPSPSMA